MTISRGVYAKELPSFSSFFFNPAEVGKTRLKFRNKRRSVSLLSLTRFWGPFGSTFCVPKAKMESSIIIQKGDRYIQIIQKVAYIRVSSLIL